MAFYHPTAGGAGCAVRFELRPARRGREGCLFAELAAQKTVAVRNGEARQAATFDWPSRVAVKLGFADVCAILSVLEGRAPSAGGDKGLYHQSEEATTMIGFRRVEEPAAGYAFEVSRKARAKESTDPVRLRIVLSDAEGCGLRHVLAASMFHLCFYAAEVGGARPEAVGRDQGPDGDGA